MVRNSNQNVIVSECCHEQHSRSLCFRVPGGEGPVAMSGVICTGAESTLFGCRNRGFMAPPPDECNRHSYDLGVKCEYDSNSNNIMDY